MSRPPLPPFTDANVSRSVTRLVDGTCRAAATHD
jgi:hypothetical protein